MSPPAHSLNDRLVRAGFMIFVPAIALAMTSATRDATEPIKLLTLQLGAAILLITLAVGRLFGKQPLRPLGPIPMALIAFVAINVLAAAVSDYPRYSLDVSRHLMALAILAFVASQVYHEPRHLLGLLLSLCAGVAVSSVYAFLQKFGLDPFPWAADQLEIYSQLPGTFGNPNIAGHVMILAIIAAAYFAFVPKFRWVAAVLPLFLVHLYFTGHRAGILALGASIALCATAAIVLRKNADARRAAFVLLALFLVGGLALVALGGLLVASDKVGAAPLDSSLLLRANGYYNASQMVVEKPMLGHGPGVYLIENPRFWTAFEREWFERMRLMNRNVHNEYLEAAVAAGFAAAALYAAFILAALLTSMQMTLSAQSAARRHLGFFFLAFFGAFAVDGLFGFNFNAPASGAVAVIMAGALAGLTRAGARVSTRPSIAHIGLVAACGLTVTLITAESRRYAAELNFHQGRSYLDAERYDRADQFFEKAEAFTPWDWRYPRYRGIAHYDAEAYPGAITHLERSHALNPNWVTTLIPLANAALNSASAQRRMTDDAREGFLSVAIEHGKRATRLHSGSQIASEILARALYTRAALRTRAAQDDAGLQSEWQEAADALQGAIRNGPESPGALFSMLGQAQSSLNLAGEAQKSLAEALRLEPTLETHWQTTFNFALKHDAYAFMDDALTRAIGIVEAKDAPRLRLWQARAREAGKGDPDRVVAAYAAACAGESENAEAWVRFGRYALRAGRLAEYKESLLAEHAKDSLPDVFELNMLTVLWTADVPPIPQAADALLDQLSAVPETQQTQMAQNLAWIGEVLAMELTSSTLSDTERGRVLMKLGTVHSSAKNPRRAVDVFAAASAMLTGADQLAALWFTTDSWITLGEIENAEVTLQRAKQLQPDSEDLRVLAARILAARGDTNDAANQLRVLLRSTRLTSHARQRAQQTLDSIAGQ